MPVDNPPASDLVVGLDPGDDYTTINAAVQASSDGHVIYVRNDQTYNEAVANSSKLNITLMAHPSNPEISGSIRAILDGQDSLGIGISLYTDWSIHDFDIRNYTDKGIGESFGQEYSGILIEDVITRDTTSMGIAGVSSGFVRRCLAMDTGTGFRFAGQAEACIALRCTTYGFMNAITLNCDALECQTACTGFYRCKAVNCSAEADDGIQATTGFAGLNDAFHSCHLHGLWDNQYTGGSYAPFNLTSSTGTLPARTNRDLLDFTLSTGNVLRGKGRVLDVATDYNNRAFGPGDFNSYVARFDADSEHLILAAPPATYSSDYSLFVWCRTQATPFKYFWTHFDESDSYVANLHLWASQLSHSFAGLQEASGAEDGRIPSGTLADQTWMLVGLTYNVTTFEAKIYLNGAEIDSQVHTQAVPLIAGHKFYLAHHPDPEAFDADNSRCLMSNLSMWSQVLTSGDVSELWNNGVPGELFSHSAVAGLVSWHKLNNSLSGERGGVALTGGGADFIGSGFRSKYPIGAVDIPAIPEEEFTYVGHYFPLEGTVLVKTADSDEWIERAIEQVPGTSRVKIKVPRAVADVDKLIDFRITRKSGNVVEYSSVPKK